MPANLAEIPAPLLRWYDNQARQLPWRSQPTPYRVWVSEIMLQQTRVEAVKPYFERFMQALPSLPHLAQASEQQLLKLWEGLGYYSRARNLHRAAGTVLRQHGGELPADYQQLLALPGIGEYTAGAIASIAFGLCYPAIDGNVLRVAARLCANGQDIALPTTKAQLKQEVTAVLPHARVGDFNQALMELGATVCLPGTPRCPSCPLQTHCHGLAQGVAAQLPVKAPRKRRKLEQRTVFVLLYGGSIGLLRRPESGLLAGLWELPNLPQHLTPRQAHEQLAAWGGRQFSLTSAPAAKHIFTHIEWHMQGYLAQLEQPIPGLPGLCWFTPAQLGGEATLPAAFRVYRALALRSLLEPQQIRLQNPKGA